MAVSNKTRTMAIFNTFILNLPSNTIIAYTDGSLSREHSKTTCAVFIPKLDFSCSCTLSPGSSIFTAELHSIQLALNHIYHQDGWIPEACIVVDSSSAIKAILSRTPLNDKDCVHAISNLLECLKSSGTKIYLTWVPSHAGIEGNEKADRLANSECSTPSGNIISNKLTASEKLDILKTDHTNATNNEFNFAKNLDSYHGITVTTDEHP